MRHRRLRVRPWMRSLLGPAAAAALVLGGLGYACGDDDGAGECGDGQLDPGEECDYGMNYNSNVSCFCSGNCLWMGSGCGNDVCGDGTTTGAEECDGLALGGQTCEGLGYAGGTLACTTTCTYDTSGCGPDLCGNGVCDPGENTQSCAPDCPAGSCGDCVCGPDEDLGSCPADCPYASCLDHACPGGETCYDTVCVAGIPACRSHTPPFEAWPDDSDLEPNGTRADAVTLPCGDDGVVTNPSDYMARCPSRQSYTNGFMNLAICPAGEHDLYGLYLLGGETVSFSLLYLIDLLNEKHDIDLTVWRWDDGSQQLVEVSTASSTNDNESLTVSASGEGWYYVDVYGKCSANVNVYTLSFTLNP